MNDLKKEFYEDFVNGEEVVRFLPERFVKWIESKIKEETEKAYEEGFNKAQEVDEEKRNKLGICKKCGKPIGNYQQCMNCLRRSMAFTKIFNKGK